MKRGYDKVALWSFISFFSGILIMDGEFKEINRTNDDLKILKRMREHNFRPPITLKELTVLEKSIERHENWVKHHNCFHWFSVAPTIPWKDLPWDQHWAESFD